MGLSDRRQLYVMQNTFLRVLMTGLMSLALALTLSCQGSNTGAFFQGALGLKKKIIVASSSATATGPYVIAQYSIEGKFEKVLVDLTLDNRVPRDVVMVDPFSFLINTDTVDGVLNYNYLTGLSSFVSNANLNGVIGNMTRASNGDIFIIEGTNIESFDVAGTRIGNPRIGTTVGACTMNGTVKGMAINSNGTLIVGSQGNDDILFYDVSDPASPACLVSNQTLGNVDPNALVAHSNGFVYVAQTGGTDDILQFNGDGSGSSTSIYTNLAVINNPTAMVELPDGTLLVASDATNNIVRIDTSGNVLNNPYIQDAFTGFVQSITITEVP